jgi:hypothetical protein
MSPRTIREGSGPTVEQVVLEADLLAFVKAENLSVEKLKQFQAWHSSHLDGGYSFHLTPVGIGTKVDVVCPCGAVYDLNDYDKW